LLGGSGSAAEPTIGQLLGRLIGAGGGYGLANLAMGSAPWKREKEKQSAVIGVPLFFGMRRLLV
jgi:hypothetical protein